MIWCSWARERREVQRSQLAQVRPRIPSQLPRELVSLQSRTMNFRSERFVKSFSFLQVKILPQKEVS
jgi:hypothetical protein